VPGLASLHTHSRYCDGKGEIEEYVIAAIDAGLDTFGASGHAPLPFPCDYAMSLAALDSYRSDVRRVGEIYGERIPTLLGIELDYLPGLSDFYAREFFRRGFDYVVSSVHYVGEPEAPPWCYDESEEAFAAAVQRRHAGDVRPILQDYYGRVCQMVTEATTWDLPVIVGHLDRVGLWNRDERYFSTSATWYVDLVEQALAAIARSSCVLELNASGWDKRAATPNPSPAILRRALARNIPVIVSADAHQPGNIARRYAQAVELLREVGYKSLMVPRERGWLAVALPD
jgi:histidinol-phosphatase (PHP family)